MDIILPRRSGNTSETISLLGSLFQAQSDDNKVLDVDEATEFAISLVTAMDAQTKLFNFYDDKNIKLFNFIKKKIIKKYNLKNVETQNIIFYLYHLITNLDK